MRGSKIDEWKCSIDHTDQIDVNPSNDCHSLKVNILHARDVGVWPSHHEIMKYAVKTSQWYHRKML